MWNTCKQISDEIISLRRELHQIPERGNDLPETQALICRTLESWGIPFRKGAFDSSVIGEFACGGPGKTILLRADVDALPIQEATGLPFASRHEGLMHACGHDAHGAMLLGALKVLYENRHSLRGNIRFLFQTGEENTTGALIARDREHILEGVDAVFGLHVGSILSPDIPSGTIVAVPGCCMASTDRFLLHIRGKGCHGSTPEKGVDPVTIAAHVVIALQEILAREIAASSAGVVTIGRIEGGSTYNVIPDEVVLEGTVRTLDSNVRRYLMRRVEEIAKAEAAVFRGECKPEMFWGHPPVISDPALAKLTADAAARVLGEEWVQRSRPSPNMGGEDFSIYLEQKPGCFFFLSSADPKKGTCVPHHNAKFDVDESVLWRGSAVFTAIAEDFLNA